jgi:PAS domain S-box-containing protein
MENKDLKILAIDDNQDNLITLKALIMETFPEALIFTAQSGEKGIEAARLHDPDTILLDILMPGLDGFEVCRRLKADKMLADIPVVFLTAMKGDRESRIKALESGGEAFLTKPIDESELLAQIRAMIKIKKANLLKRDETQRLNSLVEERTRQLEEELKKRQETMDALKKSEELFKHIFESANVGKSITMPDGSLNVNQAFCDMLGYTRDEMIDKKWQDLTYTEDIALTQKEIEPLIKGEKDQVRFNKRYQHKNGNMVWTNLSAVIVRDSAGIPQHFVTTVIDITEQIKAQKALEESEKNTRTLIDGLPESALLIKPDGTIITINTTVTSRINKKVEEITGTNIYQYFEPEVARLRQEYAQQAIRTKKPVHFEDYRIGRNMDNRIHPVLDDQGNVQCLAIIGIDITDRIASENKIIENEQHLRVRNQELQQKNEFIQTILDQLPIGLALNNIDEGAAIYMNHKFEEIYGWNATEIKAIPNFFERVYPDVQYRQEVMTRIISDIQSGDTSRMHWENIHITRKDGSKGTVNAVNIPLYDQNTMVSTVMDITQLKRAEEMLTETNELLSKFIQHSPIYAFIKEVSPHLSRVIMASDNYHDMIGINGSQMIGKTMQELFPPDLAKNMTADDWKVVKEGKEIVVEEHFNERHYTTIKFPIKQGKRNLLAGYTIDITERIQREERLRILSRAMEQSPDSILITNTKGEIEFVNPALIHLSGYSFDELFGMNPRIFSSGETSQDEYALLWNTILDGKIWEGEFHNRKKNGELFWEAATITPIFDQHDHITHFLAIRKDITEQKRMTTNLIEAKEKAEESDRLKSAFLANMSHEIRTPMNSIMGFASLLPEEESRELMCEYASIIVKNSEQLVSLIDNIVLYSKLQTGIYAFRPIPFEAHRLMYDIQQSFNLPSFQKNVKLIYECHIDANTTIHSDYDKLRQILTNLITNAFKYTNQGEIKVGCILLDHHFQFSIKDTGIGIPARDLDHIFDRFYRGSNVNEAVTRGTGLGLSIVKELVQLLGGQIWVESETEKGSTFYFTIPVQ